MPIDHNNTDQNTTLHYNLLCLDCSGLWEQESLTYQTKNATDALQKKSIKFYQNVQRCIACKSERLVFHEEIVHLELAHIDCDSFFASVEKRDNPKLIDKPVIIGGESRGVVAAACYVARMYGIHSAMPMFRAKQLCPNAVIIHPKIDKYRQVGRQIRHLMQDAASKIEPLSIDEAYLQFLPSQTHDPYHHPFACQVLAALLKRIEYQTGISVSAGLSYNKMLAKLASDFDKPRGFKVIGRQEAKKFLAPQPISRLWGVGPAMSTKLKRMGINTIGQMQQMDPNTVRHIFGKTGSRLVQFANASDNRKVESSSETKSVSVESTFAKDIASYAELVNEMEKMTQQLIDRANKANFSARALTLKLRDSKFRIYTRTRHFKQPTLAPEKVLELGHFLLLKAFEPTKHYRLLGLGFSDLEASEEADPPDLFSLFE